MAVDGDDVICSICSVFCGLLKGNMCLCVIMVSTGDRPFGAAASRLRES